MTITVNLIGSDSEWAAGQDNPHIPVNEGIAVALILRLTLKGKGTSTPPGSPAEGDAYIIGASPTGDWSTFTQDNIAYYDNGSWREMNAVDDLTLTADDGSGGTLLWRYVTGTGWTQVTLADPDTLYADTTDELQVGYTHAVSDQGTQSSGTFTPAAANGAMQKITNGGAFTLSPPSNNTSILLKITNNATAGAITTTGFTKVTGDSFTTTDTHKFVCNVDRIDGETLLHVRALQ